MDAPERTGATSPTPNSYQSNHGELVLVAVGIFDLAVMLLSMTLVLSGLAFHSPHNQPMESILLGWHLGPVPAILSPFDMDLGSGVILVAPGILYWLLKGPIVIVVGLGWRRKSRRMRVTVGRWVLRVTTGMAVVGLISLVTTGSMANHIFYAIGMILAAAPSAGALWLSDRYWPECANTPDEHQQPRVP